MKRWDSYYKISQVKEKKLFDINCFLDNKVIRVEVNPKFECCFKNLPFEWAKIIGSFNMTNEEIL